MQTRLPTVDYATPPKRDCYWRRAWRFVLAMPLAAFAGSALANWHGWGWDIQRLADEIGPTTTGVGCATVMAAIFASPFAAVVAEFPRWRALTTTLLASILVFYAGYRLGKAVFIVLHA